jgi:hypothetical protein
VWTKQSAHHALVLVNAGEREPYDSTVCERRNGRRRGAREGACTGYDTTPQILRLILNLTPSRSSLLSLSHARSLSLLNAEMCVFITAVPIIMLSAAV